MNKRSPETASETTPQILDPQIGKPGASDPRMETAVQEAETAIRDAAARKAEWEVALQVTQDAATREAAARKALTAATRIAERKAAASELAILAAQEAAQEAAARNAEWEAALQDAQDAGAREADARKAEQEASMLAAAKVAESEAILAAAREEASRHPSGSGRPKRRSVAQQTYFIGPRLKEVREKSGIPLRKLAQKLSLSVAQICRYEQNKVAVSLPRLTILAEYFQVPATYLQGTADSIRETERHLPDDVRQIHSRARHTSDQIMRIQNPVRQKRVIAIVQSVVSFHSQN